MTGSLRFKDGAWRVTVSEQGRRRYATVRAPNTRRGREEAGRVAARMVTEGGVSSGPRTVDDLLAAWLAHIQPTRAARTVDGYESKARLHISPHLGRCRLDRLTAYDIDQLAVTLRRKGLAAKSVAHTMTALHTALTHAVRWGWITRHPMDGCEPVRTPAGDGPTPPPADVVRAAIASADLDFAALVHTAASTGHRRGSLLGLRWSDLHDGRATFRRAIAHVAGQPLIVKETKAGTVATVTLEPTLAARLATWRAASAERAMACGTGLPDTAYIWTSDPDGATPWHPSTVTKRWRAIAPTGVRFHDLKHFAVTQMLAAGVPVWEVAQRTGTSSTTIERVYGHFIPGRDAGAANVMERLLG